MSAQVAENSPSYLSAHIADMTKVRMKMFITPHCKNRLLQRLSAIVSLSEVEDKVNRLNPRVGETWVFIKRLEKSVYIECSTQDGAVNGDTIWAVIKRRNETDHGAVVTIMVRRWEQKVKADFGVYS